MTTARRFIARAAVLLALAPIAGCTLGVLSRGLTPTPGAPPCQASDPCRDAADPLWLFALTRDVH
jgi:hypothetical protein